MFSRKLFLASFIFSILLNLTLALPVYGENEGWTYVSPYGKPKIVGMYIPEAEDGQTVLLKIDVKNVGETGASFDVELDYPKVMINSTPGRPYIGKGEIETLTWGVSRSSTKEEEYTLDGKVTVTAAESGESDTVTFTQIWHGAAFAETEPVDESSFPWGFVIYVLFMVIVVGAIIYLAKTKVMSSRGD